jgi:glyoxalase/bleomycin resistance protein/dioxygenase superfamily protein
MAPLAGLLGGRIDQIGIVVPDLKTAMDGYIASLGVTFQVFQVDESMADFSGSSPQFRIRFAVAPAGLSSIELIQPVAGTTIYSVHLQARGPGIHHLGVYVDSLPDAKKGLRQRGYKALLEGSIRNLGQFAYFEAPDMHCIVEPLELSPGLALFVAENAEWYTG